MNTFRIKAGLSTSSSTIELNGERLRGVRRVSFDLDAGKAGLSVLKLEIVGEVLVEGQFVERLIARTEQVLDRSESGPENGQA